MQESREEFSLALSPCKNFVFALGGFSQSANTCLRTIEKYTILTNTWQTLNSQLDTPLKSTAVATMPDGIYLIGGFNWASKTFSKRVIRLTLSNYSDEIDL